MITSASELLSKFISAEVKKLAGIDMRHMPTLGSAYEAIAKAGIDQKFVLPPGLDLRVVSGFVEGLHNQYDCLLVNGEGQRYGLTNQFIYPIEKVLCIFEVKKTLRKAEFADAIDHLAAAQIKFGKRFAERYEAREVVVDFQRAARAFAQVTARRGAYNVTDLGAMPIQDRALFGCLARQIYAPLTVLLGFDGYTTEYGLRKGLLDIISGTRPGESSNASVDLLPSLVTCNSHSLVKCNNQPYLLSRNDGKWFFVASTRHNPARILLELLWTKISNYCDVKMPWGPDMEIETLKELLAAEALTHDDTFGWKYTSFEYSEKRLQRKESVNWEPAILSAAAMFVVTLLGARGGSTAIDKDLGDYLMSRYEASLDSVVQELLDSSCFARSDSEIHAITQCTIAAQNSDGTGTVALERGRLQQWYTSQGLTPLYTTITVP